MSDETKILMTVPKDVINAQVTAAVAATLNKDPEALVRAVVDAAMSATNPNGYSRVPIWQEEVNKMIREVAAQEFKAWLETQRPTIAKQIKEKLAKNTKDLLEQVTTKMAAGFLNLSLSVHWPDSRG